MVRLELEPEPVAPAVARAALSRLRPAIPPPAYEDLRTVVTELVANSVVHGPGRPIQLEVEIRGGDRIRGQIEDQGAGVVRVRDRVPDRSGGYGLKLVDALTDRWGVDPGSTDIWFELTV